MPERWYRHCVVLLELKEYDQKCPAVTMQRTNLRSSWRNLSTILGQQQARNFPIAQHFSILGELWFLTTGPLICISVFFAELRERILLLPHVFALLHWL